MRDDMVSVAEAGARPSVSLLRALKREFAYYCIELAAEEPAEPEQLETAYVMGGCEEGDNMSSSMERYDATLKRWRKASSMDIWRKLFGACVIAGEIYITGGFNIESNDMRSVEKCGEVLTIE
jgi:hypothetical protein